MAHWRVVESEEFTAQLQALGDIKRLDDRLRGLTVALWVEADNCPFVITGNRLRVATLPSFRSDEPPLTIWFEIIDDMALLRWIEPDPDSPKGA